MEFGYKFDELKKQIECLVAKANSLAEAYAEAEDFTLRFLKCCSKHNIKMVSIGKRTDLIESAKGFPFGCGNSVFADGRDRDGCLPFGALSRKWAFRVALETLVSIKSLVMQN